MSTSTAKIAFGIPFVAAGGTIHGLIWWIIRIFRTLGKVPTNEHKKSVPNDNHWKQSLEMFIIHKNPNDPGNNKQTKNDDFYEV